MELDKIKRTLGEHKQKQLQSREAYETQFYAFIESNPWFDADVATEIWTQLVGEDLQAAIDVLGMWQNLAAELATHPRYTVLYRWTTERSRGMADYVENVVSPGTGADFGPRNAWLRVFQNLDIHNIRFIRTETGASIIIDQPSEVIVPGMHFSEQPSHQSEPTVLGSTLTDSAEIPGHTSKAELNANVQFYHAEELADIKIDKSIAQSLIITKLDYLGTWMSPEGPHQDA